MSSELCSHIDINNKITFNRMHALLTIFQLKSKILFIIRNSAKMMIGIDVQSISASSVYLLFIFSRKTKTGFRISEGSSGTISIT